MKLEIYANGIVKTIDSLNADELKLVISGALVFSSVLECVGDVGIIITDSEGTKLFDGALEGLELLSELI